jgi:hypothetical protein
MYGETITQAIITALRERLVRLAKQAMTSVWAKITAFE